MKLAPLRPLLLCAMLAPWGAIAADGNVEQGRRLYRACSTCHQDEGGGSLPLDAPAIAGRDAWSIVRQLNAFARGSRGDHPDDTYGRQMALFAKALPDEDAIGSVAAYVSSLPPASSSPVVAGDADRGRNKFASCIACHGINGRGMESLNAPALAGLDDWYVARQLQNFRDGVRGYDSTDAAGQQMRGAIGVLGDDDDIRDVAAYIATLP